MSIFKGRKHSIIILIITAILFFHTKIIINIKQYNGYPSYNISIGVPNETAQISSNIFSGSIKYKDQIDSYTYVAPITGRYRFDFSSDNVQNNYKFYSSDNSELASTSFSSNRKTIDLTAGEIYSIKIVQSSGLKVIV